MFRDTKQDVFHIVHLTGGRDSSACAVWLKFNRPRMYQFTYCKTGVELPETLEHLKHLERVIGHITYIETPGFEQELINRKYFFPSPKRLWCEQVLRIRPSNKFIGRQPHVLYLGYTMFNRKKMYKKPRLNRIYSYPLIEHKILSSQDILNKYGLYNRAYDIMPHHNCWCCFQNSYRVMCKIFEKYPHYKEKFKEWHEQAQRVWGDKYSKYNYFLWKRQKIGDLLK